MPEGTRPVVQRILLAVLPVPLVQAHEMPMEDHDDWSPMGSFPVGGHPWILDTIPCPSSSTWLLVPCPLLTGEHSGGYPLLLRDCMECVITFHADRS